METVVSINGYNHVKCAVSEGHETVPKSGKEQILVLKEPRQDSQRTWPFYLLSPKFLPLRTYLEIANAHMAMIQSNTGECH